MSIAVRAADGRALVTVSDSGPGLSTGEAEHAFERFWRANRPDRPPGSGLGLAIVRATAERHGGTCGSRERAFTLDLPLTSDSQRALTVGR